MINSDLKHFKEFVDKLKSISKHKVNCDNKNFISISPNKCSCNEFIKVNDINELISEYEFILRK